VTLSLFSEERIFNSISSKFMCARVVAAADRPPHKHTAYLPIALDILEHLSVNAPNNEEYAEVTLNREESMAEKQRRTKMKNTQIAK